MTVPPPKWRVVSHLKGKTASSLKRRTVTTVKGIIVPPQKEGFFHLIKGRLPHLLKKELSLV